MPVDFNPLVSQLEFKPTSMEDYLKPFMAAEALYQERQKQLDEKADALAAYLPYINDGTPEAQKMYNAFNDQLNRNLAQLGSKGWNLNPEPLIAFKTQFRDTNARLGKAAKDLEELRKRDAEEKARLGDSLFIRYKEKNTGKFVEPNIDNMLMENVERHTVNGQEVQANAEKAATALSARTKAAFSSLVRHGMSGNGLIGYWDQQYGFVAGVPSAVMMNMMMDPEHHQQEIKAYLDNVQKFGGERARQSQEALFTGEFRDAMGNILDMTDYDSMTDNDKARINNYLWVGAYQGFKYDEDKKQQVQNYNWEDEAKRQQAIKDAQEQQTLKSDMFINQIYQAEDREGREDFFKMANFLGLDLSDFGVTGVVDYNDMLAYTAKTGRLFDGSYGNDFSSSYSEADRFIRDESVRNKGVKEYFSLFKEDGALKSSDELDRMIDDIYRSNADNEYYNGIADDKDIGESFVRNIGRVPGARTAGSSNTGYTQTIDDNTVKETKKSIKEAILTAFGIASEKREEILKTDGAFDKFVKENKVNSATFKNALIDQADKYANDMIEMQCATFADKNENIIRNILTQCTNGKGGYTLKMIEGGDKENAYGYVFSQEQVDVPDFDDEGNANGTIKVKAHRYKLNTTDVDEVTPEQLFGEKGEKSFQCKYTIPDDPTEGLIVIFPTGKRALIPTNKLGNLYPAAAIKSHAAAIKTARKMGQSYMDKYKKANIEAYKIEHDDSLSEEEKRTKLEAIKVKQEYYKANMDTYENTIALEKSNIVDLFTDNISGMYKPNII